MTHATPGAPDDSQTLQQAVLGAVADAVVTVGDGDRVVFANEAVRQLFGWRPDDLAGCPVSALLADEGRDPLDARLEHALDPERAPGSSDDRLQTIGIARSGATFPLEVAVSTASVGGQRLRILTMRDLSEPVRRSAEIERLTQILEASTDMIVLCDDRFEIVWANPSAATLATGEAARPDLRLALTAATLEHFDRVVVPAVRDGGGWRGELELRTRDGAEVPVVAGFRAHADPDGAVAYVSMIAHDVTEAKVAQARLAREATHDALTGLPNRVGFQAAIERALARCPHDEEAVAVLFLDLDRFKLVNDTLGHEVGDELLVEVARRVQGVVRSRDTVARLGGDEFVVVCEGLEGRHVAEHIAGRICETVRARYELRGHPVHVGASVGIAMGRAGDAPADLLRNADVAVFRAKARGRDRAELFDEAMRAEDQARVGIELALRHALDRHELHPHYQPVVDIEHRRLVGFEVSVGWDDPQLADLAPEAFMPVAEDAGLVIPLDRALLVDACHDGARWHERFPDLDFTIGVNLSGRQLHTTDLVDAVREAMLQSQLPPERLCLEITENAIMQDFEVHAAVLAELRDLGVRIALDDFGTGQSSLHYLRRLPIDAVKVDRSFTFGLGTDPAGSTIVAAVVSLAQTLGLTVVATGVEQIEHVVALASFGCDRGQGDFYAGALDPDAAEAMLADGLPDPLLA